MADEKDKEPRQHPEDGAATPGPAAVPRGKQKDKQKGKKPAEGQKAAPAEPEGPPPEPAPPARLHEYYGQKVRPRLAQQFGLKNPHEIPKLVTIAGRDDTAQALLRELGMPFRGEAPVAVG